MEPEKLRNQALAIADAVQSHEDFKKVGAISVDELAAGYEELHRRIGKAPRLTVLSFGDKLAVRFPDFDSALAFVMTESKQDPKAALANVPAWKLDWLGPPGPAQGFSRFLLCEIRANWVALFATLSLCLGVLTVGGSASSLKAINLLGTTSLTIFVSVFVLFVIGDSARQPVDFELYRTGRLHDFLTVDKHMTTLAILALGVGLANVFILSSHMELRLLGVGLPRVRFWATLGTSVFLTAIAHLLRSIPSYYFKRLQTQIERQAIGWVFIREQNTGDRKGTNQVGDSSRGHEV